MSSSETGSVLLPAALADTASINLDREGNEIMLLTRSRVLMLLRQLQEQASARDTETVESVKDRGLIADLIRRIRRFRGSRDASADRSTETRQSFNDLRVELADEVRTLDLRIEQFIDLAALAGSPPEYAQELRTRSNTVGRMLGTESAVSGMSADTFKELTRILDLVQLTRRDVERRNLHNPRAAARFILARFPVDDAVAFERIVSVSPSTVRAWAAGTESPSDEQLKRLIAVAQIVYDLSHSLTPPGLTNWFGKQFDAFHGRSPLELLDAGTDSDIEQLRGFARSLRTQVAT